VNITIFATKEQVDGYVSRLCFKVASFLCRLHRAFQCLIRDLALKPRFANTLASNKTTQLNSQSQTFTKSGVSIKSEHIEMLVE
jgi:hypothetical protein